MRVGAGIALRAARIEAHARSAGLVERALSHEVAMALNGYGGFAVKSCNAGSRAARRPAGIAPSAFDHVMVGATREWATEEGPQVVWRPMPTRGPGVRKVGIVEALRGQWGTSWTDDVRIAFMRSEEEGPV